LRTKTNIKIKKQGLKMGVKQLHTKYENQDHSFWGESSKRWSVPLRRRGRTFNTRTRSLMNMQEKP